MSGFTLAQFSDTHLVPHGQLLPNGVDSLRALSEALTLLQTRIPFDALLISGDLVETGSAAEYAELRRLLRPIAADKPVFLMMGNHDRRLPFLEVFGDWSIIAGLDTESGIRYVAPLGQQAVLVVLDSLLEGRDEGLLDPRQLEWLDTTLAAHADKTVLLAVHHPMIDVNNAMMNAIGLQQTQALHSVLVRHRPVATILCGHLHRDVSGSFAGAPVRVCPSSAFVYAANVNEQNLSALCNEPPAFLVHHVDADGGLRSASHGLALFHPPQG